MPLDRFEHSTNVLLDFKSSWHFLIVIRSFFIENIKLDPSFGSDISSQAGTLTEI